MRLRTAHRNRRRVLARRPRKPPPFTPSWREWLDKILPDLAFQQNYINEHSIFNRIYRDSLRPTTDPCTAFIRTDEGQRLQRQISESTMGLRRGYAINVGGDRLYRLAKSLWESQERKCAECQEPTPFEEMTKRGFSFNLICNKCYEKRPAIFMIIDDIEEPNATPTVRRDS